MTVNKIIVSGASISDSPWFTWADFLEGESGIKLTNLCCRGAGNEYIVSSIAKQSESLDPQTLVVVMLTTIDKFDWYVEGPQFSELQTQKHRPIAISDSSGFWSTGSWFPFKKEYFFEQYYTDDYFCAKSIQQILLLQSICASKGAELLILFDSPIWNYVEREINQIGSEKLDPKDYKHNFLSKPLSKIWADFLNSDIKNIATTSLIGFCWDQHLPWYNTLYRGHPPSGSHYKFYEEIVRPRLIKHLNLTPIPGIDKKIVEFNQLWNTN